MNRYKLLSYFSAFISGYTLMGSLLAIGNSNCWLWFIFGIFMLGTSILFLKLALRKEV